MFTPMTAPWRRLQALEPASRFGRPAVVEAHPVDHGTVGDQAEEPRAGVVLLRDRGDRPHFDVPESEGVQPPDGADVLVEAGGDAERRVERQTERRHLR